MQWFAWVFFSVQLAAAITWSVIKVFWQLVGEEIVFGCLLVLVIILTWFSISATPQAPQKIGENPQIAAEIGFWENWQKIQPTHRDVLLNLATLHQAQQNTVAATYASAATAIDPNYHLK